MTRIDFYILQDLSRDASMRFACRLGMKGYQAGQPVHIHTDDQAGAIALDELMWDYPKHRFLPHQIVDGDTAQASSPIQIGYGEPALCDGLLINLSEQVPVFFGRFDRVAEVIVGETRDTGRDRYKHYRDRGYKLHHHELNDWEQT
ncbi:MAG: DNA polymerase III subunit chi [Pseudomonadota bacterium]